MHLTARRAKTEGLVRCVWECCGERALQVMRYRDSTGWTVLYWLARIPNMRQGKYAVFAEHCTNDDLRTLDTIGRLVLFVMEATFVYEAKAEEQEENVASVMCAVVQRLGPGALLAETTRDVTVRGNKYSAGSTPRSVLLFARDSDRALLQRLEEAAGHPETAEPKEKVDEARGSAHAIARSAAAPAPAGTSPAGMPAPSAERLSNTLPENPDDSSTDKDDAATTSTTQTDASPKRDTTSEPAPDPTPPSARAPPPTPRPATPQEMGKRLALQLWIVNNTSILAATESYAWLGVPARAKRRAPGREAGEPPSVRGWHGEAVRLWFRAFGV